MLLSATSNAPLVNLEHMLIYSDALFFLKAHNQKALASKVKDVRRHFCAKEIIRL